MFIKIEIPTKSVGISYLVDDQTSVGLDDHFYVSFLVLFQLLLCGLHLLVVDEQLRQPVAIFCEVKRQCEWSLLGI